MKSRTGIILAGGRSSRMGYDKGLMRLSGICFIEHCIDALKPLVDNIIIVSNNSEYDAFGYPRVTDRIKNAGPLAGLYSGLYHSNSENNLVLSCDVPLIKTAVLELLLDPKHNHFDVVQLKSNERTMPLIASYKKRCMHKCLELLKRDERRLQEAVKQLATKTITIDSNLEFYVKNINTIDELNTINHDANH